MKRAAFALLCCFWLLPAALHAAEAAHSRSILLVAAEGMLDPRFRQSVVLVTRHGRRDATVGVILNRRLDVALDRLMPDLKSAADHRLHYGGPVSPSQIVYIVRNDEAPAGALKLAERVFISSNGPSLRGLLAAATPPNRLRVFHGIASWAPLQLEAEIERGDWHPLPLDADDLFTEPPEGMWTSLLARATQLKIRLPAGRRSLGAIGV